MGQQSDAIDAIHKQKLGLEKLQKKCAALTTLAAEGIASIPMTPGG